jgi:cyanate lyase
MEKQMKIKLEVGKTFSYRWNFTDTDTGEVIIATSKLQLTGKKFPSANGDTYEVFNVNSKKTTDLSIDELGQGYVTAIDFTEPVEITAVSIPEGA